MGRCETKNRSLKSRDALQASRSVVLVGMMGAGKSTVGRRLAKRLGMDFVDADDAIEEAAGLSISDIFARYGEAHFREGERRVIKRLLGGHAKVIATGGGAFTNAETRAAILAQATAVWLDADIETLVDRVARRSHRPLLKGGNAAEVLRDLADKRNPFYAEAPIRVVSQPAPHAATVDAIIAALRKMDAGE